MFMDQKWGALVAGRYADIVVLDRDLFAVPPDQIGNVRVRYTIVGGKVVYAAESVATTPHPADPSR
jgi:predicted amidohydrolase YtcJ